MERRRRNQIERNANQQVVSRVHVKGDFPTNWDWRIYVEYNPDLQDAGITTEALARNHWGKWGHAEGRIYSKEQTRDRKPPEEKYSMYYLPDSFYNYTARGFYHNVLSAKAEEIEKFSKMLKERENFTLVRYNDGEWIYGLRIEPFISNNMQRKGHDPKIFQISDKLIQIINSAPDYYISVDVYSRTHPGVKDVVDPYIRKIKNLVGAGIFNVWSMYTGFVDIFQEIAKRKTLVVGPADLKKLKIKGHHIITKHRVHYITNQIIKEIETYLDKEYEKDMIILYSCSFTAKIAADHFYKKYGNTITQLDVGAVMKPFIGEKNRPWHRAMVDEIKKKKVKVPKYHLSTLKNADALSITYYVGNNPDHVKHLKECKLVCKPDLDLSGLNLYNVELIRDEDPQLYFYKLSRSFKKDYMDRNRLVFRRQYNAYIHEHCQIGQNVQIAPGCVIGACKIGDNVRIDANVTIYGETVIGKNTIIEAGTVIGSAGVMWVWDGDERVYLEQLGNVVIEENCRIGSQIEIVRGSANESTVIGKGTCMAHGTLIGHGCKIGKYAHFANGVKLGGSVHLADYVFLGSGAIVVPGAHITSEDVIIGAGAVVTKDISEEGVYVGSPAKRTKSAEGKLTGMPTWRK